MSQSIEIKNRVASSGLITLDLDSFFPQEEMMELDLKDFLFKGLILKEKDFRQQIKQTDWTIYQDKTVNIICSTDAIIPMWAYMLISTHLISIAQDIYTGPDGKEKHALQQIRAIDAESYRDERVIIKGCGVEKASAEVYNEISKKLKPVVKSLMFGEACSTVPIYKKPRKLD